MKVCPITYEEIPPDQTYSKQGLRQLSPRLMHLNTLPYTALEQRLQAEVRSGKMSIGGVQPKLSVILNIHNAAFDLVDQGGKFILKPPVESYEQLPENEDLTMRLAASIGIPVPLHGLLQANDGSWTYFIRRFDRKGRKKIHVEDFAQLSHMSRDTKYNSSMEKVAQVLELCTFPAIARVELFKRALFSYLVGNEDMHLKNFSLIQEEDQILLSPAYDLVNSTLVLTHPKDELALPIRGKKSRLTRNDLVQYFALERLRIAPLACQTLLNTFETALPRWTTLIQKSFLSNELQRRYLSIVHQRFEALQLTT